MFFMHPLQTNRRFLRALSAIWPCDCGMGLGTPRDETFLSGPGAADDCGSRFGVVAVLQLQASPSNAFVEKIRE